ncbi:MAG: hypothetical protein ACI4D8_01870 [Wujia sp.]
MRKRYIAIPIIIVFVIVCVIVYRFILFTGEEDNTNNALEASDWEIIYDGMSITPEFECDAIINQDNTLCFLIEDKWTIEVVMSDKSYDEYKGQITTTQRKLEAEGYNVEQEADTVLIKGKEYLYFAIHGEILLADGITTEDKNMEVIVTASPDGRSFVLIADITGVVEESLNMEVVNEQGLRYADLLIGDAELAEAAVNDSAGTAWYAIGNHSDEEGEKSDTVSDSLLDMNGETTAVYALPADTVLTFAPDNTKYSSEKWYEMPGDIDLFISTDTSEMYSSASVYIEKSAQTGDKKVGEIIKKEIEGRNWYYYTYTTANVSKEKTELTYYLRAATDLENGAIFKIFTSSKNQEACDVEIYQDIMGSVSP